MSMSAFGDVIPEPCEVVAARDWLGFADIAAPAVTMIAREQQFAEKIHAYTVPRPSVNSRVRDLVDMYLLIASGSLAVAVCAEALRRTFARRKTHAVPRELVPPPADWGRLFRSQAEECGINMGCQESFEVLRRFWAVLYENV